MYEEKINEKISENLNMASKLLHKDVKIYFLNINVNTILINSKESDIVNITIKDGIFDNIDIKKYLEEKLNTKVESIEEIPYNYYNDYTRRYYILNMNKNNILSLDSEYIYSNINSIDDEITIKVIEELFKKRG